MLRPLIPSGAKPIRKLVGNQLRLKLNLGKFSPHPQCTFGVGPGWRPALSYPMRKEKKKRTCTRARMQVNSAFFNAFFTVKPSHEMEKYILFLRVLASKTSRETNMPAEPPKALRAFSPHLQWRGRGLINGMRNGAQTAKNRMEKPAGRDRSPVQGL